MSMTKSNIIPVITIDGPSGVGKGTVSRALARRLGWHYLDSGAIYRSLAYAAIQQGVKLDDVVALTQLAENLDLSFKTGKTPVVLLGGVDITEHLALESTGNAASLVAALGPVRKALLDRQRGFRQMPGLVADGRDMGTVVFADARHKFFLTATAEARAIRRYKQLKEKGVDVNLAGLTKEIEERDRRDRDRSEAPLRPAEECVFIDSTMMSVEEVIAACLDCISGGELRLFM